SDKQNIAIFQIPIRYDWSTGYSPDAFQYHFPVYQDIYRDIFLDPLDDKFKSSSAQGDTQSLVGYGLYGDDIHCINCLYRNDPFSEVLESTDPGNCSPLSIVDDCSALLTLEGGRGPY